MPWLSNQELEERLKTAGESLSRPPSTPDELLALLDWTEKYLSNVEQSSAKPMVTALSQLMKALVSEKLMKHSDIDVKVGVASCISEITRITAPEAPLDDDKMKDVLQLIVSSLEDISDTSSKSYFKRITVLETVAKVRSCVILLDLECDEMVIEMFQHFLKAIRDYHAEVVFGSMETIMTLIIEESEDISPDILKPILSTLKKNNETVLPVAKKLAERVIRSSVDKLRPYLPQVLNALDANFEDYSEVVASVCQDSNKNILKEQSDMVTSPSSPLKSTKDGSNKEESPRLSSKRKRTPGTKKASGTIEYGENLVGSKIKVWWPKDRAFYEGVVHSFDSVKKHAILYADGDQENLNLNREKWEFIGDDPVSDAGEAVEHSSDDASPDMKKKGTSSEASSKMEISDKSKLKDLGKKSGGKSKDDEIEPKTRDNSKSSGMSEDETIKSKATGKSKDVAKTPNNSKQDSQKTAKPKGKTPQSAIGSSSKSGSSKVKETDKMEG